MDKVSVDGAIFICAFSLHGYDAKLCGGSATGPIPNGSPSLSRSTQPIRRWPMSSPIGRKRCVGVHIILMKVAKRESNLRRELLLVNERATFRPNFTLRAP
jgi:hypothetical protein